MPGAACGVHEIENLAARQAEHAPDAGLVERAGQDFGGRGHEWDSLRPRVSFSPAFASENETRGRRLTAMPCTSKRAPNSSLPEPRNARAGYSCLKKPR